MKMHTVYQYIHQNSATLHSFGQFVLFFGSGHRLHCTEAFVGVSLGKRSRQHGLMAQVGRKVTLILGPPTDSGS